MKNMNVLVINAGSSSLKYQLVNMADETVLAKGNCERIGQPEGVVSFKNHKGVSVELPTVMANHTAAFACVKALLTEGDTRVLDSLDDVAAIGHRVVQGGDKYDCSVRITPAVLDDIKAYAALAPLHNPAAVQGIEAATATFGTAIPQVAVFDTAFHQTMPPKAYMFGVPYEYYEKYGVRRYGFHGTSHRYVSARCCELLGKPDGVGTRIITCHLGSGSSIAAIKDGKVVDTTMGMTPLDGFMMGTRSGTLDPSVVTFLMEKEGLTPAQMDAVLNKKSGLLGVSGVSNDERDLAASDDPRAALAVEMRNYQVAKFIGAYAAALGGVDAIVFTAGVGENQGGTRADILGYLGYLGVEVDPATTASRREEIELTTPTSRVRAFVIPTDEEMVIARDTAALV